MVLVTPAAPKQKPETNSKENSMSSRIEALTIQEDVKEGEAEDEEGLPIYPYERLKIASVDPVTEIDVTKREVIIKETLCINKRIICNALTVTKFYF